MWSPALQWYLAVGAGLGAGLAAIAAIVVATDRHAAPRELVGDTARWLIVVAGVVLLWPAAVALLPAVAVPPRRGALWAMVTLGAGFVALVGGTVADSPFMLGVGAVGVAGGLATLLVVALVADRRDRRRLVDLGV